MKTNEPFRLLGAMPCGRVYDALCDLIDGQAVTDAVARRFESIERAAHADVFSVLQTAGFVEHHAEWTQKIRGYLEQKEKLSSAAEELTQIERRLKTVEVQVRHAAEQRARNRLLKSKAMKWEEDSKQSELSKQKNLLTEQRNRLMVAIKGLERTYDELKFLVSREGHEPPYMWRAGAAQRMTEDGYFLLSSIQKIPSNHYAGRQLSDVLALGGILI